ncbi:DUF421 domain-containing protein [Shouchella lonarensis]|uniref:Uncharacterized membrane protein YcaP, DUF421 family n=1 Tax=Shouchella lonarensis TaxID=1464122 RepID=A0A1G6GWL4_9BACI|nr:DUF421 domain-containing protein [Shouchella lonarensis]SDB86440.1 Uncharacterized membrane protein YcaP, DUF421 family [Shouchella lonarensis]
MTDLGHVFIRGAIGFLLLFLLARLMGKKHITDMTYYEYIVGIAIGSLAAEMTFSPHVRMSNFVFGMFIWALFPMITSKLELKSFLFRTIAEGKPTVLIENGKINEANLRKEELTVDELMIHLRQNGVFKLADVESAVMEKSGLVSVMKKSDVAPLTPKDAGIVVAQEHQPQVVIVDGNVMEKSLLQYGYTKEWLRAEVAKQGANDFSDVFLAQIDSTGAVYVDLYNDKQHVDAPKITKKLFVVAQMKQLQADLRQFAMQTKQTAAKDVYQQQATQIDKWIKELSPHIVEPPG